MLYLSKKNSIHSIKLSSLLQGKLFTEAYVNSPSPLPHPMPQKLSHWLVTLVFKLECLHNNLQSQNTELTLNSRVTLRNYIDCGRDLPQKIPLFPRPFFSCEATTYINKNVHLSVCLKHFGGNVIFLVLIKDRKLKFIVNISIKLEHN